jgi:hypothetical protein
VRIQLPRPPDDRGSAWRDWRLPKHVVVSLIVAGLTFASVHYLIDGGTTSASRAPSAVPVTTDVSAVALAGRIRVSWGSQGSDPNRRTVARLRHALEPAVLATCTTETTSCTFPDLANGVTYAITVEQWGTDGQARQRTVTAIPRPAVLTSAGITSWFDGADVKSLLTADESGARTGRPMTGWKDRSPNGVTAVKNPAAPEPSIGSLANHTAVHFADGAMLDLPATKLPIGAAPSTVYLVASADPQLPPTCSGHLLAWGAAARSGSRLIYNACSTSLAHAELFGTPVLPSTGGWKPGQVSLLKVRFGPEGITTWLDRAKIQTWTPPTPADGMNTAAGTAAIGAAPWCLHPRCTWNGEIAEIIVAGTDLSPAQDQDLQDYLTRKWIDPPATAPSIS